MIKLLNQFELLDIFCHLNAKIKEPASILLMHFHRRGAEIAEKYFEGRRHSYRRQTYYVRAPLGAIQIYIHRKEREERKDFLLKSEI